MPRMDGGRRVLVTGATGRVGFPLARTLAARGDAVFGLARFSVAGSRERLAAAGVEPVPADLATVEMSRLPDVDHVFHAGAVLGAGSEQNWQHSFHVNAQVSGDLVRRYAGCQGLVYCSTGSAYRYQGTRPLREDDAPGVHLGIYSLAKIAGEQVVTHAATEHGTPVTIVRIFSTYGPEGGRPIDRAEQVLRGEPVVLHPDAPNRFNPVFEDDHVALSIRALEVADTPPVVVNLAGSVTVSAEDYCAYVGSLVGREPIIRYDDAAYTPLWADVTRMHDVLGHCRVPWRDGFRRALAARHPDLELEGVSRA